jgi:hypothetical protein
LLVSFGQPQHFSNTSNNSADLQKQQTAFLARSYTVESDDGCLGLSWPVLPFALSSRILYLGTSSSRIALASFLVTCMSDLGKWSPCSRHCQLAGPPLDHWRYLKPREPPYGPGSRQLYFASVLLAHTTQLSVFILESSVWRFPTGTQVRGSTVKSDHLAIMGHTVWCFHGYQNSFYGRIASNVRFVCSLSNTIGR